MLHQLIRICHTHFVVNSDIINGPNVQDDNELYKTRKRLKNYTTRLPKYLPSEILLYFYYYDTHKPADVEDSNKLDSFFISVYSFYTSVYHQRQTTHFVHLM